MSYQSKNMNYIFNVEYFKGLDLERKETNCLDSKNNSLELFQFHEINLMKHLEKQKEYRTTSLFTLYPGLMIGTGNLHSLSIVGLIKCGFTFDYVTGLPYLPGSSLKGILRACFPEDCKSETISKEYSNLICNMLPNKHLETEEVMKAFKKDIFEHNDIFLGAYPVLSKESQETPILQMEYITPHNKGKFKNPIPINLLKIRSNVEFKFSYLLHDFYYERNGEEIKITADDKNNLFKQFILLMGVGAKTNVGFGKFSDKEQTVSYHLDNETTTSVQNKSSENGNLKNTKKETAHKCRNSNCNNLVTQKKEGGWYPYCPGCYKKGIRN